MMFFTIVVIFLIIWLYVILKKQRVNVKEGFTSVFKKNNKLNTSLNTVLKKTPDLIYDKFYSEIYDELFKSDIKNEYEVMLIHKDFLKNKKVKILDVGCGTGSHLRILARYGHKVTGLDQSKYMIKKCQEKKINGDFVIGDYNNHKLFKKKTFDGIICLFYTIYYSKNLDLFFSNISKWLTLNGHLFLHVVNVKKFDPVLDKSSSLIPFFDPQKYVDGRNTKTYLTFNKFNYNSDWIFKKKDGYFIESFDFNNEEFARKNLHYLYLYRQKYILKKAEKYGFKLVKVYDEFIVGYHYNYILVLEKKYG